MSTLISQADELIRDWPTKKLFQKNLDALQEVDDDLAQKIAKLQTPCDYELAIAKDGSVSFLQITGNGKTEWLGNSSIPMIFSQANQERIDIGQSNMVMQGVGHGADVLATLKNMSPYQALFVVERDPVILHLAFQLRDFSHYLINRQLVILLGQSVSQVIDEFFQKNPGYLIIQKATVLPYYTQKKNHAFAQGVNTAMETSVAHLAGKVAQLIDQQAQLDQNRSSDLFAKIDEIKVLHGATTYNEMVISTAHMALNGLSDCSAIVDDTQYDKPDQASNYAQLQRMINFWPHLVILVDALRGDVSPALPASVICVTLLRNPQERLLEKEHAPAKLLGQKDLVFPATLEQLTALKQAGYPEEQISHLPLAANTRLYKPIALSQDDTKTYACDVALVASRVDTEAKSYGIQLPTHQKLWQAIVAEICDDAGKYHCGMAHRVLKRAQSCGVEINEEELLDHFGKLIEDVLSDAILRDFYASFLLKRELDLKIWGHKPFHPTLRDEQPYHWDQSVASDAVVGQIAQGQPLNALYNVAKIQLFISSKARVDQNLLNAIAAGAFVLVKSHPSDKESGGLGDFFKIGKEIITFDTPNDLVRKTKQYLRDEPARKQIAHAAHARLLEEHTAKARMGQLLTCI
jgi:spore maturation protein CgeB